MKKNIVLLFSVVLSTLIMIGCQKEKSIINETKTLTHATRQAINSGSLTAIKQSYSLLTNEEKQTLWDTKWNTILKIDANQLTSEQLKIVMMIKTFVDSITIESLYKNPIPGETFIKSNLSYFEKHFSKAQLYLLIECSYFCDDFSLLKSMEYLNPFLPFSYGSGNCECYYTLYCDLGGGGGGTCVWGECSKIIGCGLTGTSNCKGRCL